MNLYDHKHIHACFDQMSKHDQRQKKHHITLNFYYLVTNLTAEFESMFGIHIKGASGLEPDVNNSRAERLYSIAAYFLLGQFPTNNLLIGSVHHFIACEEENEVFIASDYSSYYQPIHFHSETDKHIKQKHPNVGQFLDPEN